MSVDRPATVDIPFDAAAWVAMRRACEILGVNPSTLRAWTDQGRVPVFLTPGGHRRYREIDLRELLASRSGPSVEGMPLHGLLVANRERFELVARRAWHSAPWFRDLDDGSRRQFRVLGNSLLGLLGAFLAASVRRDRERTLGRGREVATQYGEFTASIGLSLAAATEAFVVFRKPILDIVHDWLSDRGESRSPISDTLHRVNEFMDQILVTMASAHERARLVEGAPRS